MKYFYLFLLSAISFSFTTDSDCRKFNFGVSPEMVKSNESAVFIKEQILLHNLKALVFADYKPDALYQYTYTFHSEKLNGLKTKKLSLTGDNSFMYAMNNYNEALSKYSANCDVKIKQKVSDKGLKSFHLTQGKSAIYVMVVQESQDFFLVENILKK